MVHAAGGRGGNEGEMRELSKEERIARRKWWSDQEEIYTDHLPLIPSRGTREISARLARITDITETSIAGREELRSFVRKKDPVSLGSWSRISTWNGEVLLSLYI